VANAPISPDEIRREVVHAIFLEDRFFEVMALKGGAALLAHSIGTRASLDVDVSLRGDFEEADFDSFEDAGRTMLRALERHFAELGHGVFDYKFERKPSHVTVEEVPEHWGGYMASFKLADAQQLDEFGPTEMRRRAIEVSPNGKRTFKIDISRREYVGEPVEIETEGNTWRVYTPSLLLYEKLRALCQQHPSYSATTGHRPRRRPRDLLDIYEIVDKYGRAPDSPESLRRELRACFDAKAVPLELLLSIGDDDTRDFHREGWEGVADTTARKLEPYEHYHGFVAELAREFYSTATAG
jgi:hypothetical protein